MIRKIIVIILILTVTSTAGIFVPKAKAIPVVDGPHIGTAVYNGVTNTVGVVSQGLDTTANAGGWLTTIGKWVVGTGAPYALLAGKMLAFVAIQKSVQAMIGKGDTGDAVIRDYEEYLFLSPQKRAMEKMDAFFNATSKGRLSIMNYEGVGSNYDSYLVTQARKAIEGSSFTTNIQNYASEPKELFVGGNMKGLMVYMQCANNVACYTMTTSSRYDKEFSKAQKIAAAESPNGFRPEKENGRITKPSDLAKNALMQVDDLGTKIIMNAALTENAADSGLPSALTQVAEGAAITVAARMGNYGLSDAAGRAAIRNKNGKSQVSLGYTLEGGFGANIGGATINTGLGSVTGQTQVGNTCATLGGDVNANGARVTIDGNVYDCDTKGKVGFIEPSITYTKPSIVCTKDSQCNIGIIPAGTFLCDPKYKKCVDSFVGPPSP